MRVHIGLQERGPSPAGTHTRVHDGGLPKLVRLIIDTATTQPNHQEPNDNPAWSPGVYPKPVPQNRAGA